VHPCTNFDFFGSVFPAQGFTAVADKPATPTGAHGLCVSEARVTFKEVWSLLQRVEESNPSPNPNRELDNDIHVCCFLSAPGDMIVL
jgi:hypothetical protein